MNWIEVGTLEELERDKVRTVKGADRSIAVFMDRGQCHAVDNRCPHMGFPLNKGSVSNGILTCHWHHARFALDGGCAFDLFADDVPVFPVRIEDGKVLVGAEPSHEPDEAVYFQRLERGLQQNLSLLQAKGHLGLLEAGVELEDILRRCVAFGSDNHETWRDGMTLLALTARLWPLLGERPRIYALTFATSRLADNCAASPRRRERGPLSGSGESRETLTAWADRFFLMRHRDGLERTLLTLIEQDASPAVLHSVFGGAILQRVFMDTGHLFDFVNQAMNLVEMLGGGKELLAQMVPLLVREAVEGMGEEDSGSWRSPDDLIVKLQSAARDLPAEPGVQPLADEARDSLESVLLGSDPDASLKAVVTHLRDGVEPVAIARSLAFAAAWRMARFSPANDLRDWFTPMHVFTYCNALVESLERTQGNPRLLPGLLHGAMAIFQDRFLNDPPAYVPEGGATEAGDAVTGEAGLQRLLSLLDQRPQLNSLVRQVAALADGDTDSLVDTLCWGTVREDLDFHHLQVLDAAASRARSEPDPTRRTLYFVAVARHLGSHCPTARARRQSTDNALKLYR